ncbi:(p)ppGpp synthetase [Thermosipho melanesiensis]|uniref:(P)ppGpp synthetase I, SpoT/RelA n=2 Tax=Thermosipho melanesiensis TaxID=46541 RepID=A6LML4_THEM4|nr:bifunctional (p)ppGpp synthetase/guanosine-3',5'-bis(diphosphate) 3'-pyrophosphohydrolase [Thermosipho melanesiensis]ABR31165.1 (p)ppGpp synthetase I, SpoT/RelA [Thermosipho melanesiensis BI429]APT74255.1 (p)ppGpp synthetase [Thermosipho melanesiensis]OOC36194.1 (p)ppGpp synthetase [Thermosipho melanesiensis]OOC37012.1 (p)ppGpp synthetase [Thermosipho melanesiensis]OOC37764.1 (p)ppGpp synthetase [Thermosipho melanesiensis]
MINIEEFINNLETILKKELNESEIKLLEKAIKIAEFAHEGFYRKSGEPFITHPLEVSKILASLNLDLETIITGILHDVVEDSEGKVTLEDIEKNFGKEIALIVDGVTKVSKINAPVGNIEQKKKSETIQKMLFAMAEDVRVIFVKLADRLHNMRTIHFVKDPKKRKYKALETLEVYAPIAHKLGIHIIKWELEDLSFKVLYPKEYYKIKELVAEKKKEREERTNEYVNQLRLALKEHNISAKVEGRYKHYYSIWKKMKEKKKKFEEIYDLIGIRAIVNDVNSCYSAIGVVHQIWVPLPGRFKDYIAAPKSNGYKSIHTTVITQYGEPLEIQIRDVQMHNEAEYGLIAHWIYKEKNVNLKQKWLIQLLDWRKELLQGSTNLSELKNELQLDEVFVLTPKGEIIHMPIGSTVIDFAYAIHTEIGHHFSGAKVNGKIVPIDYKLKNGDVVEILVNKASKGPSLSWIKHAKSPRTKAKIRRFFREKEKEKLIESGKDVIRKLAKRLNLSIEKFFELEKIQNFLKSHNLTIEELYSRIGEGSITFTDLLSIIEKKQEKQEKKSRKKSSNLKNVVVIDGITNLDVHIAKCCMPVPGDEIVGVSSRRGITVHRINCKNIRNIDEDRIFQARWAKNDENGFTTMLEIEFDKNDRLPEIMNLLISNKINVTSFKLTESKNWNTVFANITIVVKSLSEIHNIKKELEKKAGILRVKRK